MKWYQRFILWGIALGAVIGSFAWNKAHQEALTHQEVELWALCSIAGFFVPFMAGCWGLTPAIKKLRDIPEE